MITTHQRPRRGSSARVGTLVAAALSLALSGFAVEPVLDIHKALPDLDTRVGSLPPSGAALSIVAGLGARAEWNRFGTPASVVKHGGYLATGLSGSPTTAARNWIRANKALFKLSDAGVDALEMINDSMTAGNDGHAVIFRQKFGSLPAGPEGLITVGIRSGKVASVSSSSAGDQPPPGAAVLPATTAWMNAAIEIGRPVSPSAITGVRSENGWTIFTVDGFSYFQRARLVGFPTPTQGVRPAFECNLVDNQDGILTGYTSFVDAQTGQVLLRQNRVDQLSTMPILAQVVPNQRTFPFTGGYTAACSPLAGPFTAVPGDKRIDIVATSANPSNDIVLNLYYDHDNLPATPPIFVQAQDLLTSPEHLAYAPPDPPGVPPGNYFVEVCPFAAGQEADNFAGAVIFSDVSANQFPYPPQWKLFPANPDLGLSSTDSRKTWCWETDAGCDPVHPQKPELSNLAARGPWDHLFQVNLPSFSTIGNAAVSSEAWFAAVGPPQVFGGPVAIGPGPTAYTPHADDRKYSEDSSSPIQAWSNKWQTTKCNPVTSFLPPEFNDRDAGVINLFSMHNRMHDFSYFLGFTERNFNLQDNNFGNTAPGAFPLGREKDPELGFFQAGAQTGAFGPNPQTSGGGRNNANQLTLQDGVPGITNMYLWQPLGGGWYGPCVDGDYDMSVIGHEYTHAISNRMVGGPDGNLSGHQAGAMGESWSDQVAVEYLNAYGFVPTSNENPFSVGSYVTGNKLRGIRNYGMNVSPLNYSNVGYDISGPQVHADGEIWSAHGYDLRQFLISKLNATYPASNMALQRKCADGLDTADHCPGNRRWIQIMFDAFLMMPSNVSYLIARDQYLAADQMRFNGYHRSELWGSFARRGMGIGASTNGNADTDPIPSFELPTGAACPTCPANATISFKVVSMDEAQPGCTTGCNTELGRKPLAAKVFVGRYEARSTPLLTTLASHNGTVPSAKFSPGTYEFLVVADGYGHFRFQRTFTAGQTATIIPWVRRNWASKTDTGSGAGAVVAANSDGVNHANLIDDTEATQWQRTGALPTVAGSQVIVDLAGGARTVSRVNVSALLFSPAGEQPRLTALRQFEIYTCTASVANGNCALPSVSAGTPPPGFSKIFTSPADAFPGVRPRPAAPDLQLRQFIVPSTSATHVAIRVLTNQCTGNVDYQGDQDMDPTPHANSDCIGGMNPRGNDVRIAELQVFSGGGGVGAPGDPVVTLDMAAPATAAPGATITYSMSYTNFGPEPSTSATITDVLPTGVTFVSATGPATYNSSTRTVTWNLGTVPVLYTGSVQLKVKVPTTAPIGTVIPNQAEFRGALTVSPPTAAAVTLVLP